MFGFPKPEEVILELSLAHLSIFFLLSPLPHSLSPKYPSPHQIHCRSDQIRQPSMPARKLRPHPTHCRSDPPRKPVESCCLARERVARGLRLLRVAVRHDQATPSHELPRPRQATLCQQLARTRRTRGDPGAHPAQARRDGQPYQPRPAVGQPRPAAVSP